MKMTNSSIRPFQKVLGSFDKNSFWRFEIKRQSPYENMFADGLRSAALKKLLLGLEGVALIYSLKDHKEKRSAGKAEWLDDANVIIKLATYFVKSEMIKVPYKGELVKLGDGPLTVANGICAVIDFISSLQAINKDAIEHDLDTAVLNGIAALGYFTTAVGYGALSATFFAGAALSSSTGIGIAPGLLLAFTGSVIAIGGKALAAGADNTPIENMLLKTPWGTNPDVSETTLKAGVLQKQYIGVIRLNNSFSVSINHDTCTAMIHLRRLEPTTIIIIYEVTFGIPVSADGERSTTQVVSAIIGLSDVNCRIVQNDTHKTTDLHVDLLNICPSGLVFPTAMEKLFCILQ